MSQEQRRDRGAGPASSPSAKAGRDAGVLGVLRLTDFRRLWLALGLSSFGDWLGFLAVTAMAASLGAKDSYAVANLAVSGVLILRLAPSVLLGPIAGAFVDRIDRKLTLVIGDLLRFVLYLSIPLIGTLWWLFVATILTEIIGLFWMPAKDATVPNLVPKERLEQANQLSLATTYGSAPIAALFFTGLSLSAAAIGRYAPWVGDPPDVAMYANACTNLIAALTILRLPISRLPKAGITAPDAAGPGMLRSIREGWAFIGHTRLIRGLVLGMLGAFGAGGFVIGVAPMYARDMGAGSPAYGMLFAAVFTGLAVGMWVGPRLLPDLTKWRLFAISLIFAGTWLCCMAIFPNSVLAVFFTALVGMAGGVAWVTGYTMLGLEVADEMRGRTFAFVQNGARIVLIVVMAAAPGLAALFGERTVMLGDVPLSYNGAALTLGLAGLIAVMLGLVSYRTMNDHPDLTLAQDVVAAWRSRPALNAVQTSPEYSGFFIAFEGGDGAGKSSQIQLLEAWLRVDLGFDVVTTREPGATELGQTIRQLVLHESGQLDPHAEALMFAADRAQHIHTRVLPALQHGSIVITDRYLDSSIAYQGGGRGFDPAGIERISMWATGALLPDLTVLIDLDPVIARKRLAVSGDGLDKLEAEGLVFHTRVRQAFLARARRHPRRYLVLDGTNDPLDLADQVKQRLRSMLPTAPKPEPRPDDDQAITKPGHDKGSAASTIVLSTSEPATVVTPQPEVRLTPPGPPVTRPTAPRPSAQTGSSHVGGSSTPEEDPWDPA